LNDNDFAELAARRARRVRDHIMASGKVGPERVLLSDPGRSKAGKGSRVWLHLQ
jgi:hypothetical protein